MRVLLYIYHFFPRPAGATYSAIRLARGLRERGIAVSFLVEDTGPEWREGGLHENFPVRSFTLQQPGKIRKLRGLIALTRHLLANKNNFDLLHIQGGGHVNLFLAAWVRALLRKPVLLKITSDGWDTPEGTAANKWGGLLIRFYRRLSGIVAMTTGQAEKCHAWKIPAPVTVIPNGVDTDRYTPATPAEKKSLRDQLQLPHDAFVLCYAGWLGHGKGTDILAEVWRQLHARDEKILLLVVGDYLAERGAAAAGADALPRSPAVRTVGRVDDVERYLKAADLFVFPSRQEGFGTVQIEAMACGLPCIVNDLPGVSSDIFPDETCGYRIPDNRIEDYIEKISRLRTDPALRDTMARAARARAVATFSAASVAARYLAFYKTLLAAPPR